MENTDSNRPTTSGDASNAAPHKVIRGSSLLLAGRVIALGVNFGVQVLIVRHLAKADYGAFAFGMAMSMMGASLAVFGIGKAFSRFVAIYHEQRDYRRMAGTVVAVLATVAGIGGGLVACAYGLQGVIGVRITSSPLSLSLLLVLILLAPLQGLDNVLEKLFAIFARPRALFVRRHILGPLLRLAAALPLLFWHDNVYVLAYCYLVAGLIGTSFSIYVLWRVLLKQGLLPYFAPRRLKIPVRELFGFSAPLAATDLVFILRTSLVTVLLEMFHGSLGVASFRAVVPAARLNNVVMESFKLMFTPASSRLFARGDRQGIESLYWRNAAWIAIVTFPLFAACFSLARPVTIQLFGQQYADASVVLAILSLGIYLDAVFGLSAFVLRAYGAVRPILINDLTAAAAAVGLGLWLIPSYGAVGAATAACATLVIQNVAGQISLVAIGAVRSLPWRYAKVYLSITAATVALTLIQATCSFALPAGLACVVLVGAAVILLNLSALEIDTAFPELMRFTLVRKVLGASSR